MKKKVIFGIILFVLLAILSYIISIWENINFRTSRLMKDIPAEYVTPLNLQTNQIIQAKTIFRNNRLPITQIVFENKIATIYSVNLSDNNRFKDLVSLHSNLTDIHIDATQYTGMENYILFDYDIMHTQKAINGIEISFLKNSKIIEFVNNDSTLAYFIPKNRGFKIKYKDLDYDDVAVKVEGINTFESRSEETTNMIIVFRKVKEKVMIYVIHKKNDGVAELDQEAFYSVFVK